MLKKYPVSARAWLAVGHPGEGAHTTNHGPVQGKMEGNYGKSGIRCWESDGGREHKWWETSGKAFWKRWHLNWIFMRWD